MSYERAWVVGVFGNALIKRHGTAPDRTAGNRIRVARASGYKAARLRTLSVLKAARSICSFDSGGMHARRFLQKRAYRDVWLTLWNSAAAYTKELLLPFYLRIRANLHISN